MFSRKLLAPCIQLVNRETPTGPQVMIRRTGISSDVNTQERMFTLGRKQEDIVRLAMFTFRGEGV